MYDPDLRGITRYAQTHFGLLSGPPTQLRPCGKVLGLADVPLLLSTVATRHVVLVKSYPLPS